MKKIMVVLLFFTITIISFSQEQEIFGVKLPRSAKVQIVNNLPENPNLYFSSGPYLYIFGIGEKSFIRTSIERGKTENVTSLYNTIICMSDNSMFVINLEAGQDYMIRIERKDNIYIANIINLTSSSILAIPSRNYW